MYRDPDNPVSLFARSVQRVRKVTTSPNFPYAISEIRAYYHCRAERWTMTTRHGAHVLAEHVRNAGLTVVDVHPVFVDGCEGEFGYTNNITLTESGVAFDCWPELGTVIQYLDLCNVKKDNSEKAERLWQHVAYYFQPERMYPFRIPPIPIDPRDIDEMDVVQLIL